MLVALVVALYGMRARSARPDSPTHAPGRANDATTYHRTIARLRAGEPYYLAVGSELRNGRYPTAPVFNWRTPLWYETVAHLSIPLAQGLLALMGLLAVIWAGHRGVLAAVMMIGAMLPTLVPGSVVFPEIGCGVLIALSAGCYERDSRWAGTLCGIAAVFVRELAVPYAVVCGVCAYRRKEWWLWVAGGIAYTVYFGVHVWRVLPLETMSEVSQPHGWLFAHDASFLVSTLRMYSPLARAPQPIAALALGIGLIGLSAPSLSSQVRWGLAAYLGLFTIAGQPFDTYWGYVVCGLWAYAFAAVPEAVTCVVHSV